jgi:hypothetical protein
LASREIEPEGLGFDVGDVLGEHLTAGHPIAIVHDVQMLTSVDKDVDLSHWRLWIPVDIDVHSAVLCLGLMLNPKPPSPENVSRERMTVRVGDGLGDGTIGSGAPTGLLPPQVVAMMAATRRTAQWVGHVVVVMMASLAKKAG